MPELGTAFNGQSATIFAEYGETVRGQVRYDSVRRNLTQLVRGPVLSVVDIGGGAAIDTIWLAILGHEVSLAEPAADQLARAKQKIADQPPKVQNNITLRQCTSRDLLDDGQAGRFDLVLSHGVGMYLDDPDSFYGELAQLVKPGGHLSILEKSFYGAQASLISGKEYEQAKNFTGEKNRARFINHTGKSAWAFKPEALEAMIKSHGLAVVRWSGVRINRDSDYRPVVKVDPLELSEIFDSEYELGQRPDTKGVGQMLQFIAKNPTK